MTIPFLRALGVELSEAKMPERGPRSHLIAAGVTVVLMILVVVVVATSSDGDRPADQLASVGSTTASERTPGGLAAPSSATNNVVDDAAPETTTPTSASNPAPSVVSPSSSTVVSGASSTIPPVSPSSLVPPGNTTIPTTVPPSTIVTNQDEWQPATTVPEYVISFLRAQLAGSPGLLLHPTVDFQGAAQRADVSVSAPSRVRTTITTTGDLGDPNTAMLFVDSRPIATATPCTDTSLNWSGISIRGVAGCVAVQSGAVSFVEWPEGAFRVQVQIAPRLDVGEVLLWLESFASQVV